MEWIKHMTKRNGLPFGLIKEFGGDGYMVYFKTLELLAEGNYFFAPMIEDISFFEHEMICVKPEKIIKIYQWLNDNQKIEFSINDNKISIFYPKLEKLNPEYARKHADIVEAGRKADGNLPEGGRTTDGVERKEVKEVIEVKNKHLKEKDTRVKVLIDYFFQAHLNSKDERGNSRGKVHINGGKDGQKFKDLLKTYSEDEIKERIDWFMSYRDPWMKDKPYNVGMFASQINRFKKAEQIKPKFMPREAV